MPKRCANCRRDLRDTKHCSCADGKCNFCTWAKKRLDDCDCTVSSQIVPAANDLPAIEKGVPVPPVSLSRPGGGKWQRLAARLEIGDSVVVGHRRQADRLCVVLKKAGQKYTSRKEGSGFRVWRVE